MCFVITLLVSAFICSLLCVGFCNFTKFNVQEPVGDRSQDLYFGPWTYREYTVVFDGSGNYYETGNCRGYPDGVNPDSKWKSAQAFSIIAPVFGICFSCLACMGPPILFLAAYMFVTLFQGLVFLFFKSNACEAGSNPFLEVIPDDLINTKDCELGPAANLGIAATVLWFVVGLKGFRAKRSKGDEDVVEGDEEKVPPEEAALDTDDKDLDKQDTEAQNEGEEQETEA